MAMVMVMVKRERGHENEGRESIVQLMLSLLSMMLIEVFFLVQWQCGFLPFEAKIAEF